MPHCEEHVPTGKDQLLILGPEIRFLSANDQLSEESCIRHVSEIPISSDVTDQITNTTNRGRSGDVRRSFLRCGMKSFRAKSPDRECGPSRTDTAMSREKFLEAHLSFAAGQSQLVPLCLRVVPGTQEDERADAD